MAHAPLHGPYIFVVVLSLSASAQSFQGWASGEQVVDRQPALAQPNPFLLRPDALPQPYALPKAQPPYGAYGARYGAPQPSAPLEWASAATAPSAPSLLRTSWASAPPAGAMAVAPAYAAWPATAETPAADVAAQAAPALSLLGTSQTEEKEQLSTAIAGVDRVTNLARASIERADWLKGRLELAQGQIQQEASRARAAEQALAAQATELQAARAVGRAAEQRADEAERTKQAEEQQALQAVKQVRSEVELQAVRVVRKVRADAAQAQQLMEQAELDQRRMEVKLQQAQADAIQARAAQAAAEEQVARAAVAAA